MRKKLLLLGGGGHCKAVLDSLLQTGHYAEIGIIDRQENRGKLVLEVPIIGCHEDLKKLHQDGFTDAFIALGSIGHPALRVKLLAETEAIGFVIPNIIDLTATISQQVTLARGIYIGKNTVINAGVTIGKGAIINTAAVLEHDCLIGQFAHIAPGTVLCGGVQVGDQTHVGAKSVVKQQVKIGADSLIGMGSVVLGDIAENVVAFGHPCKEVRKNEGIGHC